MAVFYFSIAPAEQSPYNAGRAAVAFGECLPAVYFWLAHKNRRCLSTGASRASFGDFPASVFRFLAGFCRRSGIFCYFFLPGKKVGAAGPQHRQVLQIAAPQAQKKEPQFSPTAKKNRHQAV